jgi:hypothetical protein
MAQKKKKKKPQRPRKQRTRLTFSQIAFYALGIVVILSMVLALFARY